MNRSLTCGFWLLLWQVDERMFLAGGGAFWTRRPTPVSSPVRKLGL